MTHQLAQWKGSTKTADAVRAEIARRWGELGYRVKKGEKAIRSLTYVEGKAQDEEDEPAVRTYPKPVYLFYKTQVEKR
jgi:hypothetical protein